MKKHRNPRPRLSKRHTSDNLAPAPAPDVDHLLHVLRDNLRRADAFVSTAEELGEQPWSGESGGTDEDDDGRIQRHRMRVEYLIEAGKLAVRAAGYTADQLVAVLDARRGGA